jgi:VWFA-related protein
MGCSADNRYLNTHSLPQRLCAAFLVGAIASLAACALPDRGPPPMEVPKDVPAPLRLCQSIDMPPQPIADKPGYAEYAITVTDSDGQPLTGLTRKDFVASRGNEVVPIEFFRGDTSPSPVSIAVVLDSSGSMINKLGISDVNKLNMVQRSISDVVKKLDACDELALITFGRSQTVRMAQPLTTDHALLLSRLNHILPYGTTPLYDSIHDASDALASADYPKRAMIVITDGLDNTSVTSLADLLSEVSKRGVPIYTIGIGNPKPDHNAPTMAIGPFVVMGGEADYVDVSVLKQISAATGGEAFLVSPIDKDTGAAFSAALAKINATLASGYTIGVIGDADAGPQVAINGHPGATVRLHRIFLKPPVPSSAVPASPPA